MLASSAKTKIEIFAIGENVLGIQGHPEFTEDITLDILTSCNFKAIVPVRVCSHPISVLF